MRAHAGRRHHIKQDTTAQTQAEHESHCLCAKVEAVPRKQLSAAKKKMMQKLEIVAKELM